VASLKARSIQNPFCSVVIPAYNEEARIISSLEKLLTYVKVQGWRSEIIVVDDGSGDRTSEIVRSFATDNREIRLLKNSRNRGKGYSVRRGMLSAEGEVLLFTDADLSSPIEEIVKLLEAIRHGADIAIGSRWLRSSLQTQRQSLRRQVLGRAFNLLPRFLLGLNYKDTQCGFKAFTRRAAIAIFPLQKIEGWGFDPEVLFLGKRAGFKVIEVPVAWAHSEGTRIRPFVDGVRMAWEMVKIRWNASTGEYAIRQETAAGSTVTVG